MKSLKCKYCGCTEFITQLNKYDVYEVIDNKLEYITTESIDEPDEFYCRDCGELLEI
mgnify:FL=1